MRVEHPLARGKVVPDDELWTFPEGVIGLPGMKRFAFFEIPSATPFHLLVSEEAPSFGLVLAEPRLLLPQYDLELPERDVAALSPANAAEITIFCSVVLPEGDEGLRLQLRGPFLLARRLRKGVQRVSGNESHGTVHVSRQALEGSSSCSS